jgi:flagellar hook-length control protein FliK
MWIAPVQAAAPALPGTAPAAAPAGDAPAFDQALDASLVETPAAPRDGKAGATEGVPPWLDKGALAAWLLVGTPVAAQPTSVEGASPETKVEEEPDSTVEVADDDSERPIDALFVAPMAPQQQPLIVETIEIAAADGRPAGGSSPTPDAIANQDGASAQDATPAQYAMPTAAETAKAQTTQAVPARKATAAEPQKAFRLEPEAAMTPDATSKPDMSESRDAMLRTESSAPQDRSAEASASSASKTVAGARFVAGAQAPAVAVAVGAEPIATGAAAAGAAEAAPIVQPPVQGSEREARDMTVAMPRISVPGPAGAQAGTPMGGGDAQSFEEDRRSPAAQRLAAALSTMAPPAHEAGAGSAPAPVFSVAQPAAPAPIAAPVAVAAPASTTHVEAENVHNLVQAMRVTAKAGGWEATVRLKPEHLGEVTIALRVEGNNVSAVVQAESAGVRQWLMAQEDAVRSGLSEHGLQLDRFAVSRDGQRREAEEQPQGQPQQRRRAPRQAATGNEPRFEIVV